MSAPFDVRSADVLIIGAGPAGLSAATHLRHLGVGNVMVVEREPIAAEFRVIAATRHSACANSGLS